MNTMRSFYNTHFDLVKNVQAPVRRLLMDEIDWSHRLIGIKGSRGVGKTTFLLQYAKERYGMDKKCLYNEFNKLYLASNCSYDIAEDCCAQGGISCFVVQYF